MSPLVKHVAKKQSPKLPSFDGCHQVLDAHVITLLSQARSGERFSDTVLDKFGITTDAHEHLIRDCIKRSLVEPEFWETALNNGVMITEKMKEITGTDLIFATVADYLPEVSGLHARRMPPLDASLQEFRKNKMSFS